MIWVGRVAKCRYVPVAASWKKKTQNSWIFFGLLEAQLGQIRACEGIKQHTLVLWDYKSHWAVVT